MLHVVAKWQLEACEGLHCPCNRLLCCTQLVIWGRGHKDCSCLSGCLYTSQLKPAGAKQEQHSITHVDSSHVILHLARRRLTCCTPKLAWFHLSSFSVLPPIPSSAYLSCVAMAPHCATAHSSTGQPHCTHAGQWLTPSVLGVRSNCGCAALLFGSKAYTN